jgi:hypothetical protein
MDRLFFGPLGLPGVLDEFEGSGESAIVDLVKI